MRGKTFTAAIAFTSLLGLGGTAFAADPHDAYNRAFPGDAGTDSYSSTRHPETMGKAAYGTPTSSTSVETGHDGYNQAFLGASPRKPETDAMGKAAYGTASGSSGSTIDGNDAYHSAFRGD